MLPSFCKDEVTVIRPSERTERGTTVLDWSTATEAKVGGCSVQPSSTFRDYDGRALGVEESFALYAPPGADVRAGDRIAFDGNVYEIDGAPLERRSPTGAVSHLWAPLRVWRG